MKKHYLKGLLSFVLAFLMLVSVCNLPVFASLITDPPGFDEFEGCGIHSFDQAVAEPYYKATDATCAKKATYYYSCYCGEKGTGETFEHGGTLPHTYIYTVISEEYRVPDSSGDDIAYYYSCICGAKGTKTFTVKSEDVLYTNPFEKYEILQGNEISTMLGTDFSSYPSTATPVVNNGNTSLKVDSKLVIPSGSAYSAPLYAYDGYTSFTDSTIVSYDPVTKKVTLSNGNSYDVSGTPDGNGKYGTFSYGDTTWTLCTGAYAAAVQFGDGYNVNKPLNVRLPEISYNTNALVYFETSYYIEPNSSGSIEIQFVSYTANGAAKNWMMLYSIDLATGAFSQNGKLSIGQWNTVGVLLDLVNGKATYYIDGLLVKNRDLGITNIEFSSISIAKLAKGLPTSYSGSFYVDNVAVYDANSIVDMLDSFRPYSNDFESYNDGEKLSTDAYFTSVPSEDVVATINGNKAWKVDTTVIDAQNKLNIFEIDGAKISKIIYEAKYYIPSTSKIQIQTQLYSVTGIKDGAVVSKAFNDLYVIYSRYGITQIRREGKNVLAGHTVPTNEFFTVSVALDLTTATYNVYVNNVLTMKNETLSGFDSITTISAGGLIVGKNNKDASSWISGCAYIDDIKLYEGTDSAVNHVHSYGDWESSDHKLHVRRCNSCTQMEYADHSFDANGTCTECGVARLKFSGATLTMEDNISINYKMKPEQLDGTGYSNPYVVFTFCGSTVTVKDYTVDGNGRYSFKFSDIAPRMMNDVLTATLYATYEGEVVACQTRSYSVKEYCYNMLSKCGVGGAYEHNTEFKTLLVDLLNYGAAAQVYANYQTETLVNADLTAEQKSWATADAPALSTVQSTKYHVIENPTVTWKGGGLLLEDSVTMRFRITSTGAIENLKVKITTDANPEGWTISASEFVAADVGGYYIYFDGLMARQMRETVYVAVYDGSVAVSNTMTYSIESYAYSKRNDSNTALTDLLVAMMKYGDAAYNYAN